MLPLSQQQIQKLYQEGVRLLSAGRLDEAEARFATVLQHAPRLAEAHFQLGRIALLRKAPKDSLKHLGTARALKPKEGAIWQAMAEAHAALGDRKAAEAFLAEARRSGAGPKLLEALERSVGKPASRSTPPLGGASPGDVQAVIALLQAGKSAEAEKRAAALHRKFPKSAPLAQLLADSQFAQGRFEQAEASYRAAIRLAPGFAEAHVGLARALTEQGRIDDGLEAAGAALKLAPALPGAHLALGLGLSRKGAPDAAIAALENALKRDKTLPEAQLNLGWLLAKNRRAAEAVKLLRSAIAGGATQAIFYARLGEAYERSGDEEKALDTYAEAIRRGPEMPLGYALRAMFLQTLGRFDAAEADFRKAIELDPGNGENYRNLLASYRLTEDDPLLPQMEAQYARADLGDVNRMHLAFALSRAMEQIKAHDRVFDYLDTANALMRSLYPYDIGQRRAEVDMVKRAFAGVDFGQARAPGGATDFAPIFVTGLPRSGTTLVEQILASHSQVSGAGEAGALSRPLWDKLQQAGRFADLTDGDLLALGQEVESRLRAICPDTARVTDKAIQTYMFMGAVRLIVPKAHIVLVRRDPRDTLLSIYKNFFAEGTHRYAYNQRDLGLYYRMFEEVVEFWRERLPGGFYEIRYEALTSNPEEEARKLLAACELDWEDQCLNFHENKRKVQTLSVAQVRQPIYKSSQAAWKRHEGDLAEMIEALGDAVDAWD